MKEQHKLKGLCRYSLPLYTCGNTQPLTKYNSCLMRPISSGIFFFHILLLTMTLMLDFACDSAELHHAVFLKQGTSHSEDTTKILEYTGDPAI